MNNKPLEATNRQADRIILKVLDSEIKSLEVERAIATILSE